jgi:hypothetical protein
MSRKMVTDNYSTGPLYIEYLYNNSKIDNQMVSFYLTDSSDDSFADIGFFDR